MSKKQEIASNHIDIYIYKPHLNKSYKVYIENIPTPALFTLLEKYAAQQSTMDKLANTNRTMMEHVLLSTVTI